MTVLAIDRLVGGMLLLAALAALAQRRGRAGGRLLATVGLTWFAGSVWQELALLHRGPLVHLALSDRNGRLTRAARALVVVAYLTAIPRVAQHDALTLALALGVGVVAVARAGRPVAGGRSLPAALIPPLALAGALGIGALNRIADWQIDREALWFYEVAVAASAAAVLADLARSRSARGVLTDLVVELGRSSDTTTLSGALGGALGDHALEVGYWLPDIHQYVDDRGAILDLEERGRQAHAITRVDDDDTPIAVLVHDPTALEDPAIAHAVATAARLAVRNAQLQAEARKRVRLLAASRRRLVEAADAEQRTVESEIRSRVQAPLDEVSRLLSELRALEPTWREIEVVDDELDATRDAIVEAVRGIHPAALTRGGLAESLPELAERTSVPVRVTVSDARLAAPVEAAVHFVCSEALTNVTKHAAATQAAVDVRVADGAVTVTIGDDGVGGRPDVRRGSGLRGLSDRVEALGGRLSLGRSPLGGAELRASLPVD